MSVDIDISANTTNTTTNTTSISNTNTIIESILNPSPSSSSSPSPSAPPPPDNSLIEETIRQQQDKNPIPERPTIPSKKIITGQIKTCLQKWYLEDSKKNLYATVYYWTTYRYLVNSRFRLPQTDEVLRPGVLITYFYRYRLGWRPTIYHQATVLEDLPDTISVANNPNRPLQKSRIIYFVQWSLEERILSN